mgnify:CR=1 FL=1
MTKYNRIPSYKLGEGQRNNFNYTSMLRAGIKAKPSDGLIKLRKLLYSFEDVDYHDVSIPLREAIQLLEKGKSATAKMLKFNERCKTEYVEPHTYT